MRLIIIANRKRTAHWVGELVRRMERRFGTQNVSLEQVDGPDLPSATCLLLAFEKLVFRLRADGLGAPMAEHVRTDRRFTGEADLAIDVSGGAPALHPGARQTLTVLLNGGRARSSDFRVLPRPHPSHRCRRRRYRGGAGERQAGDR